MNLTQESRSYRYEN